MVYETQPTQHQFNVDHGLVWTENIGYYTQRYPEPLATTLIGSSVHKCEWPPFQKMQFMELLGRKGRGKIAEIAKIIGKSVMQCNLYLELLDLSPPNESEYTATPAAADSVLEYDMPQTQIDPLAKSNKTSLFRTNKISDKFKPLETNGYTYLETAIKSKLTSWINDLLKIAVPGTEDIDNPVFISDKHVFQTMEMFPQKFADFIALPVDFIGDKEFHTKIIDLENACKDIDDADLYEEPSNPEFDPEFVEGEYCDLNTTLDEVYMESRMVEGLESFIP